MKIHRERGKKSYRGKKGYKRNLKRKTERKRDRSREKQEKMLTPGIEPGLPKPQSGVLPLYYVSISGES